VGEHGADADRAATPYGFINYFLNTDRKQWPSAPGTAFMHNGNGLNMIYVDPENDLLRWSLDRQQRRRRFSQAADRGGGGEELNWMSIDCTDSRVGWAIRAQCRFEMQQQKGYKAAVSVKFSVIQQRRMS
jgi:hypothetical protein